MNTTARRTIGRVLVAAMLSMSIESANAGLIEADQVTTASHQSGRAALIGFVERADVARELEARGVDPQVARERIAAMSDSEVRDLTGAIDDLPAGGFMSSSGVAAAALGLAVIIALIVVVIVNLFKKSGSGTAAQP